MQPDDGLPRCATYYDYREHKGKDSDPTVAQASHCPATPATVPPCLTRIAITSESKVATLAHSSRMTLDRGRRSINNSEEGAVCVNDVTSLRRKTATKSDGYGR